MNSIIIIVRNLRRNKKDVLTELPEKTISILNNQMTNEQEAIYLSYLGEIKEDVIYRN